jgi:hypothetical protein
MSLLKSFLTAAAVAFALPAYAADTIVVSDAYARASSPAALSGGAFMIVQNTGAEADRLLSAASTIAEKTELHTHIADANGVMQMVEVPDGWSIPAGGAHALKRGGDHVMFLGLKKPMAHGDVVEVTLKFEKAGDLLVQIPVDLERGAPASASGGMATMDHGAAAGGMAAMNHGAMMGNMGAMDHGTMMGGMAGMDQGVMMGGMGAMGMAAPAAGNGLSSPVVMLTPFVRDNADALKLNDAQRADLQAWLAKPGARLAVEAETVALRAELRAAIVSGAPRADRQALADKIGANEAQLLMARSDCVDHWREVLSAEQFAQLLVLAGVIQ